jgi:glc operon protein GlcG
MIRILWLATIMGFAAQAQVVEKKALTLDGAKKVIAAGEAEAVKNRVGCNVAVVDDGGNLIAFHRIDPTFPAGARVSIGKARTAALFPQPTKNFEDVITQKGRTSMIALEDFTPLQGGVPIVVAGQIVGAVGVSGASSADQDEQFAKAGAAALK